MEVLSIEVRGVSQPPASSSPSGEPGPNSPEKIAREYLSREGYSQIRIDTRRPEPGGVRFVIKARRGDEVRMGPVLVQDGAVVECKLEVPSALFP
jgi:hypothetical protein